LTGLRHIITPLSFYADTTAFFAAPTRWRSRQRTPLITPPCRFDAAIFASISFQLIFMMPAFHSRRRLADDFRFLRYADFRLSSVEADAAEAFDAAATDTSAARDTLFAAISPRPR
jgi:hypothetical protein